MIDHGPLMSISLQRKLFVWTVALLCLVATFHAPASVTVAAHGKAELSDSQSPEKSALRPQQATVQAATIPREPGGPPSGASIAALLPQDAEFRPGIGGSTHTKTPRRAHLPAPQDNFRARAPPLA
jgi:hypothetical protein